MIGAMKHNSGRKNYQSEIMQTEKHKKYLDNEHDIMGHHLLKVKLQRGHLCKDGISLQRTHLCRRWHRRHIFAKTASLQRWHIATKTSSPKRRHPHKCRFAFDWDDDELVCLQQHHGKNQPFAFTIT
jgi:hypothetical protein